MEDDRLGKAPAAFRASSSARWRSESCWEMVLASCVSVWAIMESSVGGGVDEVVVVVAVVVVDSKGFRQSGQEW